MADRAAKKETPVEEQIRQAIERGEWDRVEGKGKPLPGLDQPYDEAWWLKQKLHREGFSLLPAALVLRRDIEQTLGRIETMTSESEVRETLAALNQRIRTTNATTWRGPASDLAPIDEQAALARWRARREGG